MVVRTISHPNHFQFRILYLAGVLHLGIHDVLFVVGAYHQRHLRQLIVRGQFPLLLFAVNQSLDVHQYPQQHSVADVGIKNQYQANPKCYFQGYHG